VAIRAPSAELLTIGDELCCGDILNTNAQLLGERLSDLGFRVMRCATVTDEPEEIAEALRYATARAELVVATGGLGPTEDDRTVDVVAAAMGMAAVTDPRALERMRDRFSRLGFEVTPNNLRQVRVPEGSDVLPNRAGLAPGFHVRLGRAECFFLPGVPREMKRLFEEEVQPRLAGLLGSAAAGRVSTLARVLHVFGLGESHVDHRLQGLLDAGGEGSVSIHFRVEYPQTHVKLVVRATDRAAAEARLAALEAEARRRLAPHCYGADADTFPAVLGSRLREQGATLAVAESCTGGLVGHLITQSPGSSDYFKLSVVAYANQVKLALLGVREETLRLHGAVSEQCSREMAAGVRKVAGSTLGLAVTGIAGPGGASESKPVGTVHLALDGPSGARHAHAVWPGEREQFKLRVAWAALQMVLDRMRET
jgi:nicotinamide-nucleotide amidase